MLHRLKDLTWMSITFIQSIKLRSTAERLVFIKHLIRGVQN